MKKKNLIIKQNAYLEWLKLIKKNNVGIENIQYKSIIKRDYCDFTISNIDTKLCYKGKKYNRAIQLEGTSVVVIPLLYIKKKIKTLLVSQFRAPLAEFNLEFPSGNAEIKSLKKSAQMEAFEELGMKIPLKDIKQINRKEIFMLPANNYSRVFFFYFKKKLNKKMIRSFKDKTYGKNDEGEYISLKLLDFDKILKHSNSASVIIGNSLMKYYGIL